MTRFLHVHMHTHISVYCSVFTCTKHAHQTHIHMYMTNKTTNTHMHSTFTHTCINTHTVTCTKLCILNLLSKYIPVFHAGQLLIETLNVWSRPPIVVTVFKKFWSFVKLLQFGILTLQGKASIMLAIFNAWGYDMYDIVLISVIVGTQSMLYTCHWLTAFHSTAPDYATIMHVTQ